MSLYPEGWFPFPEEVDAVLAEIPVPFFDGTLANGVYEEDIPERVGLWQTYQQVTGKPWPSYNQGTVGSCVSFGTASAIQATLASQIKSQGDVPHLVQEQIYGGSRVEIGKKKLSGHDGSIGAWAAKCVQQYGVIPRGTYGSYDLNQYSTERCRNWGNTGIPDDLEPECRKRLVETVTLVKSWESAKKCLASGYGIAICSNRGFKTTRDKDGFAAASGIWHHCMALIGYQLAPRQGGFIVNSWGPAAHTGPKNMPDDPDCGFWADASVVDNMLAQGDSWAFSTVQGFPARLDWRI
jgi:hypothetical protein